MKSLVRVLLVLSGLVVLGIAGLWVVDYMLRPDPSTSSAIQPRYEALRVRHQPFSVQHLHPFYTFFFSSDLEERRALNNPVCSVTDDGFRGPSPSERGSRKLAVLLGDSVVFGFASSDTTTITGYLNQIQEKYLFINAGVPSWNSTQVLDRFLLEVLPLQPDLVMVWGGYNDAAVAFNYIESGQYRPAGTPESYDRLSGLVDDVRAPPRSRALWSILFPELSRRLRAREIRPLSPALAHRMLQENADQYLTNLSLMATMARAHDIPFLSVLQPVLSEHEHISPGDRERFRPGQALFLQQFYARVIEKRPAELPFLDLSQLFDLHFEQIPVFYAGQGPDLDHQVFTDIVHLYEPGHRIVAGTIWDHLQQTMEE